MKLELYYPVKPLYINQKFGETAHLSFYKENKVNISGHNGIDFATLHGQPIYASHDGWAYYEVDSAQGHGVVIRTDKEYDYEGSTAFFKTIYWHLCDPVKEPQLASPVRSATPSHPVFVKTGDIIGYADNTGLSTGDHLHYGLKPMTKDEPSNTWYNLQQNNGMFGAIDPTPYFNGKFAQDAQRHIFNTDIELGERGVEVKKLQEKLKELGYFPKEQECTGYYGEVTRKAVFEFQKRFVVLSWWALFVHKGRYCSVKTREALNGLI